MAINSLQAESGRAYPASVSLHSAAIHSGSNDLFDLSLEAGALAGLLDLMAGNTEHLSDHKRLAIGALADAAHRIETRITAIATNLGDALSD